MFCSYFKFKILKMFVDRKVSIRKQLFVGFHLWLDIFYVSPCRKLFSSLYLSIFEHYLENNYLKKLLTRIPTFITFSKLLQITDCSIVKKSLKILPLPPGTCIMTSFVQVFLRKSVKFHDGHFDFLLLLTFS